MSGTNRSFTAMVMCGPSSECRLGIASGPGHAERGVKIGGDVYESRWIFDAVYRRQRRRVVKVARRV